ncbi:hypothetical protein Q5H92_13805 [Hymenobacter sp. M29]|uniref:Gasdermin bGSDM n=1 Tax=Hymenobacter mellowenesis TaxID=3063995 RepID=A0ABT9AC73_9BACT|nr:hypothetical protein [Hymenobacter sp. M29]MDO7847440.1 hypothetical protein [Hymenobacter sp. M29]
MKQPLLTLAAFFVVCVSSCTPTLVSTGDSKGVLGPEYIMCPAPNDLDVVGSVFGVSPTKAKIDLFTLPVKVKSGKMQMQSYETDRTITTGLLANFLGSNPNVFTASGGANTDTKVKSRFSITSPILDRVEDLLLANKDVTNKKKDITEFSNSYPGYKYYMIIEVVKSKRIDIGLDKNSQGKAVVDADVKTITTSANGKVGWNNTKDRQLSFDLNDNLTIFYKVLPIVIKNGADGGGVGLGMDAVTVSAADPFLYVTNEKK